MTKEEIVKQVKDIIVDKLGVEESEVTETASFTNDLGADSLDTVELLMEFEKVFGIKIPDEETAGIATVGDAINKVTEKLGEQKPAFRAKLRIRLERAGFFCHPLGTEKVTTRVGILSAPVLASFSVASGPLRMAR